MHIEVDRMALSIDINTRLAIIIVQFTKEMGR